MEKIISNSENYLIFYKVKDLFFLNKKEADTFITYMQEKADECFKIYMDIENWNKPKPILWEKGKPLIVDVQKTIEELIKGKLMIHYYNEKEIRYINE